MIVITLFGLIVLVALSVFQLLLITGSPLGEYAWGGQQRVLPSKLRIGSVISILVYAVFAAFLASKAGLVAIIPNGTFLDVGMWVVTGYFVLGIFMNAISRSKKERMVMTPVAFLLAVVFLLVTIRGA